MANIIRKLVSNLSSQIMSRISSSRRNLEVPIKVSFEPESNTGRLTLKPEILSIKGETKDLSATGIAFIVDSIRLREFYLVGEDRVLNAELDLPNGVVKIKLIGQRYEQVGKHLSVTKYLIGAKIKSMTLLDRDLYDEYLRHGNKIKKDKNKIFEMETTKS